MTPLVRLVAVAAPLLRDNVDTDAIIPSREIRTVGKTGLADGLFAGWRYEEPDTRTPDPAFVLNDPAYASAEILLSGANFGCGSSREHAAWALAEYGFRAVLAPSFNPIFHANAVRNGMAPVVLPPAAVHAIADHVAADPQRRRVTVDLTEMAVTCADRTWPFSLPEEDRLMLREGLDPIASTLKLAGEIARHRAADQLARPWVSPPAAAG